MEWTNIIITFIWVSDILSDKNKIKKGDVTEGELSRILGNLSDLFASRASNYGWNGLEFGKSAMQFDTHKRFHSNLISPSSSSKWLSLKVIE